MFSSSPRVDADSRGRSLDIVLLKVKTSACHLDSVSVRRAYDIRRTLLPPRSTRINISSFVSVDVAYDDDMFRFSNSIGSLQSQTDVRASERSVRREDEDIRFENCRYRQAIRERSKRKPHR